MHLPYWSSASCTCLTGSLAPAPAFLVLDLMVLLSVCDHWLLTSVRLHAAAAAACRACTCPGCAALAVQAVRMAHIQASRLFARVNKKRGKEPARWRSVGQVSQWGGREQWGPEGNLLQVPV